MSRIATAADAKEARPRLAWAFAGAAAALAAGLAAIVSWPPARGYLLFNGHGGLEARILGGVALPSSASACVNCHDGAASGGPRPIARLDRSILDSRSPRGGPPTTYDEASFCRLLREGIDPADVMVARLMPRFTIADADCAALFAYVTRRA